MDVGNAAEDERPCDGSNVVQRFDVRIPEVHLRPGE